MPRVLLGILNAFKFIPFCVSSVAKKLWQTSIVIWPQRGPPPKDCLLRFADG